ncbi:hypothetical protein Ddc_14265 [Ditylenchus destructor]|nr:hypothetical protein Ddc_14265 [Ditylenchus destructor]
MTSQPAYSTALQQALSLLPHISPTEMKVLISVAKAQWAPRFSNEILADSFHYLSRKILTEKICPVNSRYFQICVNSVPNVHKIISVGSDDSNEPTLHIAAPYSHHCNEKRRWTHGVHKIALDDFPRSAPFLRFDIVFKSMTMETEFCVSLIYRPDEYRELHNNVFTVENDATQQQLLLFKYSYLYGLSPKNYDEELRLWCRKVKPNDAKVLSSVNEISALLLQKECESLYTDIGMKSSLDDVD